MKKCITHHYACDCREEAIRTAFEFILNETYLNPEDSIVDIANEAFVDLNFVADWDDNSDLSIKVKAE